VLGVLDEEDLLAVAPAGDAEAIAAGSRERHVRQLTLLEELAREAGVTASGSALQARLTAASVLVIGSGGLGSWIALSLAAAGIGRLVLCDTDAVAVSNLNRQVLFEAADAGQRKTEVAARRLQALDPELRVETHDRRVDGPEDVVAMVGGIDLVVNCADQPSVGDTSDWVTAACLPRGIPHIVGGAYAYHVGSLGLTVVPGRTPCWRCAREAVGVETGETIRGRRGPGPSLAMFTAVTANLVAYDALRVLLGLPPSSAGRLGELDFRTLAIRWRDLPQTCLHARRS
jgi:molybdopterin/thiamine biosynthesis adenylyltransferase